MLGKLSDGSKSSEFAMAVVATIVGAWLASRGTTVDVMLSVLGPATIYVGGRSYVKGKKVEGVPPPVK